MIWLAAQVWPWLVLSAALGAVTVVAAAVRTTTVERWVEVRPEPQPPAREPLAEPAPLPAPASVRAGGPREEDDVPVFPDAVFPDAVFPDAVFPDLAPRAPAPAAPAAPPAPAAPEADDESWRLGPHGPGSAYATADGSAPAGHPVKGQRASRTYHPPGSRFHDRVEADVWFASEQHAEAAGYTRWGTRASSSAAAGRGAGEVPTGG